MSELLARPAPEQYDAATRDLELDSIRYGYEGMAEILETLVPKIFDPSNEEISVQHWSEAFSEVFGLGENEHRIASRTAKLGLLTGYLISDRANSPAGLAVREALTTHLPCSTSALDSASRYGLSMHYSEEAIRDIGPQTQEMIDGLSWSFYPDNDTQRMFFRQSVGVGMARTQLALDRAACEQSIENFLARIDRGKITWEQLLYM